jgi:hypothetical protein
MHIRLRNAPRFKRREHAAAGVRLRPDPTLADGVSFDVPIGAVGTVAIQGLAELTSVGVLAINSDAVRRYSTASVNDAATFTGSGRLYLWVAGDASFSTITGPSGFGGCTDVCTAVANGPGFGGPSSGGGAGYATKAPGAFGGKQYGSADLIGLPFGSGGGSGMLLSTVVTGGAGGGVVRIGAGKITVGNAVNVDGGAGNGIAAVGTGGGGGSGGTILLSADYGVTGGSVSAAGGSGGMVAGHGTPGGAGANGRIRIDTGTIGSLPSASPAIGGSGATVSTSHAAVLTAPPSELQVLCATVAFHLEADGVPISAKTSCNGTVLAAQAVTLSAAIATNQLVRICAVSEAVSGVPSAIYGGDDAEDRNCRAFAVLSP